jgi:hypothetical protein
MIRRTRRERSERRRRRRRCAPLLPGKSCTHTCAHIQLQDEDEETEAEADPVMQQLAQGFIPNAGMS